MSARTPRFIILGQMEVQGDVIDLNDAISSLNIIFSLNIYVLVG